MLPTATLAAVFGRAPPGGQVGCALSHKVGPFHRSRRRPDSIFYSFVANSLEICRDGFHYSVIYSFALKPLAADARTAIL
jgi:hypothetical protein